MTESEGQRSTAELIDLLDRQRDIYQQLRRLSGDQAQCIARAQHEPLLTLLSQRQVLIDQLVELSARVEPYRQAWPEFWASLDDGEQLRVRERIDAVRSLLDEVIEQDETDRQAIASRREAVATDLNQVRRGVAVNRAYGGQAPSTPRFTDREG